MTVSQHRKRLAHDAQGRRGAGARRFRFGGKKEAAGVCRGSGEPMEIQSELACNQLISLPMKRTLQAHTHRVWHNRASAAPATLRLRFCHPIGTQRLSDFTIGGQPLGTPPRKLKCFFLSASRLWCLPRLHLWFVGSAARMTLENLLRSRCGVQPIEDLLFEFGVSLLVETALHPSPGPLRVYEPSSRD